MAHVEAHVARTAGTEHRVQIGAVVIHQATAVVYELRDFGNGMLEDAQRVRVGHHHGSHLVATFSKQALQVVDIDSSIRQALHFHHIESADSCRGRIGAMGRVGDEHLRALFVLTAHMVGTNDHQSCKFTVGTRAGIQRELAQACELGQRHLKHVVELQRVLTGVGMLQGMQTYEGLHGCNLLVDDGIVFHRARAEGIETIVHTEVVVAKIGVVANYGEFVALRQLGLLLSAERCRQFGGGVLIVGLRQRVAATSSFRELENQISV